MSSAAPVDSASTTILKDEHFAANLLKKARERDAVLTIEELKKANEAVVETMTRLVMEGQTSHRFSDYQIGFMSLEKGGKNTEALIDSLKKLGLKAVLTKHCGSKACKEVHLVNKLFVTCDPDENAEEEDISGSN
jgi:hypothetical protein